MPSRPVCTTCKVELDPLQSQVCGKSFGHWRCNVCNTRMVQLHRMFGSWPTEQFRALSLEAQEQFWKKEAVGITRAHRCRNSG